MRRRTNGGGFGADRRGVSEVLGYILVFSLVIATITTTMVFGFGGLEDRQAEEQVTNIERAFDVLADNIDDMQRYEDPSRATEIRLAGGTLSLGQEVTMTVGRGSGGTIDPSAQTNVTLRPLVYESEGGTVVYEAGMVFRADEASSLARTETPFVVDDARAVVPTIVTVSGGDAVGVSSDQTVLVETERNPRTQTVAQRTIEANGGELWLAIETPRADGWARQLEAEGFEDVSHTDDRVTARLAVDDGGLTEPDRATLTVTPVSVTLRR
jgi:hypothetical protein